MAAKSVMYLFGFGTFSYALMKVVTPDENEIRKELPEGQAQYKSEALRKRQAIIDVLRGAAEGREPMYRQTKEQIDAARDQFLSEPKKS